MINEISKAINHQIEENKSATCSFFIGDHNKIELFVEIVNPEISVVIMGHQYDIYPLCNLLKQIGWQTTIVADLQKLKGDIFKIADTVITSDQVSDLLIDQFTAIILMSHDYKTDKNNLPIALATAVGTISSSRGIVMPSCCSNCILYWNPTCSARCAIMAAWISGALGLCPIICVIDGSCSMAWCTAMWDF